MEDEIMSTDEFAKIAALEFTGVDADSLPSTEEEVSKYLDMRDSARWPA